MTNRVALVTGAARGIGRATAFRLASTGHIVHVVDINADEGERTASDIRAAGHAAHFHGVDLFDPAGPAAAVAQATGLTGAAIHVLVNNAFRYQRAPLVSATTDEFAADMARLVGSYHSLIREATEPLRQAGNGSIVNLASVRGRYMGAGFGPYSVAKAAVAQLTRVCAYELASLGIRVNAVAPGIIGTGPTMALPQSRRDLFSAVTPLGRIGTPDDVAGAIGFLASEAASFITGQIIPVDGGLTLPLHIDTLDEGLRFIDEKAGSTDGP